MTRKRHVVIVDDEPNIGWSLRVILEGEGYRVTVCDSAAAFRRERQQPGADLYLLDRAAARRQRHRSTAGTAPGSSTAPSP